VCRCAEEDAEDEGDGRRDRRGEEEVQVGDRVTVYARHLMGRERGAAEVPIVPNSEPMQDEYGTSAAVACMHTIVREVKAGGEIWVAVKCDGGVEEWYPLTRWDYLLDKVSGRVAIGYEAKMQAGALCVRCNKRPEVPRRTPAAAEEAAKTVAAVTCTMCDQPDVEAIGGSKLRREIITGHAQVCVVCARGFHVRTAAALPRPKEQEQWASGQSCRGLARERWTSCAEGRGVCPSCQATLVAAAEAAAKSAPVLTRARTDVLAAMRQEAKDMFSIRREEPAAYGAERERRAREGGGGESRGAPGPAGRQRRGIARQSKHRVTESSSDGGDTSDDDSEDESQKGAWKAGRAPAGQLSRARPANVVARGRSSGGAVSPRAAGAGRAATSGTAWEPLSVNGTAHGVVLRQRQ
jgi:hypothetical protein